MESSPGFSDSTSGRHIRSQLVLDLDLAHREQAFPLHHSIDVAFFLPLTYIITLCFCITHHKENW